MSDLHLVLASASPARLALLRAAGIEPEVIVSGVDEDAVTARLGTDDPAAVVLALAEAKAVDVAARLGPAGPRTGTAPAGSALAGPDLAGPDRSGEVLVVGCDSLFTIDGVTWGKPRSAEEAVARIRSMRGREGVLRTGHHLVDVASGRAVGGVEATTVYFGPMTDAEVDAYVATGEPLRVAGSFTLDGRSAPFVAGVAGDHTNVVGLSLPLLRRLLADLGRSVTDLWTST